MRLRGQDMHWGAAPPRQHDVTVGEWQEWGRDIRITVAAVYCVPQLS